MDFTVSDAYQLVHPYVHANSTGTHDRATFKAGPLWIQGDLTGMIVAGRSDGGVSFWRSKERRIKFSNSVHRETLLQTKGFHTGPVTALAYSDDRSISFGRNGLLFSGSSDRTIKVWDIWADKAMSETCLRTLVGHGATISSIIDSKKGYIVSSSLDGSIKVWRPTQESAPHSSSQVVFFLNVQTIMPSQDPSLELTCMAVSFPVSSRNEWELFASDSVGHITYIQERRQDAPLRVIKKWEHIHQLMITNLLYVEEHAFLISLSYDCSCAITDTAIGSVSFRINAAHRFTGLVWDSSADQVLLLDGVAKMTKWSAFSKQTTGSYNLETLKGGDSTMPLVSTATWIHGQCNSLVVSMPKHCLLQQYDVLRESKCSEFTGHTDMVVSCFSLLASSSRDVVCDYDAERVLVSASADNTIRVWDSISRKERYQLQEMSHTEIACMIFAPNFRLFVTGNHDGSLRWWHPDTGSLLYRHGHKNTVSCLCFTSVSSLHHSVEEHYLVSGSYDGSLGIWLFMDHGHTELSPLLHETLKAAHGYDSNRQPFEVLCVCFHKPSQLIISGGNDGKVRCWCASDRQERLTLVHEAAVTSVCVSSEKGFLFSGSDDGNIMVWELGTHRMADGPRACLPPLKIIEGNVALRGLMVIPTQPPLLVSATADSIVRVWDYSQPQDRKSLREVLADEMSLSSDISRCQSRSSIYSAADSHHNTPLFKIRQVHMVSADNVSEPSCLGFLETPSPPVVDPSSGFEIETPVDIDIVIGLTSGAVVRIGLPRKLSRGSS